MRPVKYDPIRDFAPITQAVSSPSMLVVHPSLPVKSVRELIALARAKPGQLNYAAGTLGAAPHIAAELFKMMAGVNIVRVAYKGSGPGLIGVMTGESGLMFPGAASGWEYAKQGRVKALAICSLERSDLFPGVMTLAESGLPGFESISPQTFTAPARTPSAIVSRLNQEIVKILNVPENKARFASLGMQVVGSTPEELGAKMKAEIARVSKLVKDAGLKEE
jgi:tripartite-type tricarboxylate transporter receptor subunit TctC